MSLQLSSCSYVIFSIFISFFFFFFNDTATTEIYTLSLHDALPIFAWISRPWLRVPWYDPKKNAPNGGAARMRCIAHFSGDRKSTRLNSSHVSISYAVFCLKKKTKY